MAPQQQIKFKYVFPENYSPMYCNGTYGGIVSQGEIIMNFYLERMPLPNSLTHELLDNGLLGNILETDPPELHSTVIRHVCAGIVLNETTAKAIYEWLGKQICELESRKQPLENSTSVEYGDENEQ